MLSSNHMYVGCIECHGNYVLRKTNLGECKAHVDHNLHMYFNLFTVIYMLKCTVQVMR